MLITCICSFFYSEICSEEDSLKKDGVNDDVTTWLQPYFSLFTKAYLEIVEASKTGQKDFFGLRDFYRYVLFYLA